MYRSTLIVVFILIGMSIKSLGQDRRPRDFFHFKNKRIETAKPDSVVLNLDSLFTIDYQHLDSLAWLEQKELEALLRITEDTSQIILAYNVPVEVSEQLLIDSVWVTLREYYSTWSTTDVNPYEIDGENFADTLYLPLTFEYPNLSWHPPLEKMEITSPFGLRRWKWHYGDDIRLSIGDSVRVAFDGIVRISKYDHYGYGYYILVRHYNGLETLYGHLSKQLAQVGDVVKAGDVIGLGGNTGRSTGPHLHFEMRYQGNAIDPKEVFDYESLAIKSDTLTVTPQTFAYLKEARLIRYHRIRPGDTLSHIAYRYGISVSKICRLNGISRNTVLRVGMRLRIT